MDYVFLHCSCISLNKDNGRRWWLIQSKDCSWRWTSASLIKWIFQINNHQMHVNRSIFFVAPMFHAIFQFHTKLSTWLFDLHTNWYADHSQKISFLSSGDKPILTLKISAKNFCRFHYFADFDTIILLLGQISFELIAYCWVLCILNLYLNFKDFGHCHLLLIISLLFKWILCKFV